MAIWFFISERLNRCSALICASPERASEEERGLFFFVQFLGVRYILHVLCLCVNTYVPQTQRWRRSGDFTNLLVVKLDAENLTGLPYNRSGYNKRDKLHLYLHLPRYLIEETVQILMGRLDIQQYNLALKGCLEMTPGPSLYIP